MHIFLAVLMVALLLAYGILLYRLYSALRRDAPDLWRSSGSPGFSVAAGSLLLMKCFMRPLTLPADFRGRHQGLLRGTRLVFCANCAVYVVIFTLAAMGYGRAS